MGTENASVDILYSYVPINFYFYLDINFRFQCVNVLIDIFLNVYFFCNNYHPMRVRVVYFIFEL